MGLVMQMPAAPERPAISARDRLAKLVKCGHLSDVQAAAGDELLRHRERSQRVVYAVASGGGGASSHNPLEARAIAKRKYEQAVDHVGELAAVVLHAIVIENMTTEDAARVADIHQKAVIPVLRVALDVLRVHYRMP